MVSFMNYLSLNLVGNCRSLYSGGVSRERHMSRRAASGLEWLEHIFRNISLNICEEKRLIQRHSHTPTPMPFKDNISYVLTVDLTCYSLLSYNTMRCVLSRKYLWNKTLFPGIMVVQMSLTRLSCCVRRGLLKHSSSVHLSGVWMFNHTLVPQQTLQFTLPFWNHMTVLWGWTCHMEDSESVV